MRNIVKEGEDILVVDRGSCLNAAHLASLTLGTKNNIILCGAESESQVKQFNSNLQKLGTKCILSMAGTSERTHEARQGKRKKKQKTKKKNK